MNILHGIGAAGASLLELLFAIAVACTVTGIGVPQILAGRDAARAAGAAHYLATRMYLARSVAVARSVTVGIRFEPTASGYRFAVYVDGNGNGIRTTDIQRDVDRPLGPSEQLADQFPGVNFGVEPDLPPVDSSSSAPGSDPIRLGTSNILSFSPLGSCSSGSVYILGRGGYQYVVRVFGETGRIRVLKFDGRKWNAV